MPRLEAVKRLEEVILGQALEIAVSAGAALVERVPRLDDGKLVTTWGVAIDKVALRQGWSRGVETAQATGAGDAVARMLQALDGKTLTLSVSSADGGDEALEVNPKAGG